MTWCCAFRALLVGADAALALAVPATAQNPKPSSRLAPYEAAWAREEALGAAGAPLFLDLPAPSAALLAERRASAPRMSERLHSEWLAVKVRRGRPVPATLTLATSVQLKLHPCCWTDGARPRRT